MYLTFNGIDIHNSPYLEQHGIKGQRWGVRRYQNEDGSLTKAGQKRYSGHATVNDKTGESIHVLHRANDRTYRDGTKDLEYHLTNSSGKKIGDMFLTDKGSGEINLNWISVGKKHQGKGIAQSVLKRTISDAKKRGYERFTLEVPDTDDNARHVYSKLGFKESGKDKYGLINMQLDLRGEENQNDNITRHESRYRSGQRLH